MSNEPVAQPLAALCQECAAQLAQFARSHRREVASHSCDEILRRAVAGDAEAFAALWTFTLPLVRQHCPPVLRPTLDDVAQLVAERLLRRFRNRQPPFQAGTFAAYRTYVNLTLKSVCLNLQQRTKPLHSLEAMHAATGFDPVGAQSATHDVQRMLLLRRCLLLLPDDLHREVFRRRIVLQEEVASVLQAVQAIAPGTTQREVYQAAARCIQMLSSLPEVHAMFESDGGNE